MEAREGIFGWSTLQEIGIEVLWKPLNPRVLKLLSTIDLNRECGPLIHHPS
jgi:hypothetical protein